MPEEKIINFDNKMIESYVNELKEDLGLSIMNIREKSFLISTIRSKWLMYLFKEKECLKKINQKKKEILSDKFKNDNGKFLIKLKSEESIVQNSAIIQKLNKAIELYQDVINYIEYAMNILNDHGYAIKNAIEVIKLEQM